MVSNTGSGTAIKKIQGLSEAEINEKVAQAKLRFEKCTTLAELNGLVNDINLMTADIGKSLNHRIVTDLRKFQQEISGIELHRANISNVSLQSNELTRIFASANDLSHTLTYKIKTLDEEIHKVNMTLNFVQDTQKLKSCINQAAYALEHKDWVGAAKCIQTIYHEIPSELVDGKYANVVIPSTDIPEVPKVLLESWQAQLEKEFSESFNKAAKDRNVADITKFFQLFPLIKREETGLIAYSRFICLVIADTSRGLINSLDKTGTSSPAGIYTSVFQKFFESISLMLSQHGPLIMKYYGQTYPNALQYVINRIQTEVDSQIGLLGDTFYDMRRIDKLLLDINLYNFPVLSKRMQEFRLDTTSTKLGEEEIFDTEIVSAVSVGDVMEEFTSIFHYWALYCKFICERPYFPSSGEGIQQLKLQPVMENAQFNNKILTKLFPAFEKMYVYYFRRSLEKAISIEEVPSLDSYLAASDIAANLSVDQPPYVSVVEDVTLVLNTTLRSVVDSSQTTAVKNFVNEGYKIIQKDLIAGYFMKGLRDNQPRYNSVLQLGTLNEIVSSPQLSRAGTPQPETSGGIGFLKGAASSALGSVVGSGVVAAATTTQHNPKLVKFIVLLNSTAMGQEYFTRIINNITDKDHYLLNNFPFKNDKVLVELVLKDEFLDPFISTTNKLIQENLIVLYNQSIKQALSRLVNEFLPDTAGYTLYSSASLSDQLLILKTSTFWKNLIQPYKQTLHRKLLLTKLLRLVVVNLANMVEKRLLYVVEKHRVNELGSLKLEKDLSFFINEVCDDNYELREKFIRPTQMVLLMGMDDEEYETSLKSNGKAEAIAENGLSVVEKDEQNQDYVEDDEEDFYGINWVLTALERRKIRGFRI